MFCAAFFAGRFAAAFFAGFGVSPSSVEDPCEGFKPDLRPHDRKEGVDTCALRQREQCGDDLVDGVAFDDRRRSAGR